MASFTFTASIFVAAGSTTVTVTIDWSSFVPQTAVALISAVPSATPVITPSSTVATAELLDEYSTVALEGLAVALTVTFSPIFRFAVV